MNLDLLREYGNLKTYTYDEKICVEGEKGKTAFLLLNGYARVIHSQSNGKDDVEVTTLGPGDMFGEMSLLENKPRVASVLADSNRTMTLEIGKEHFLDLLKAEPDIGYALMNTLLVRVDNTLEQMGRSKIAFVAQVRREKYYQILKRLSKSQFEDILEQDSEYALTLLKFLSHTLAQVDRNI